MAKMNKNTKLLLGVGALVAVGGVIAYAASKPAAAATKPSGGGGVLPGPIVPPAGVTSFTFVPGHQYTLTLSLPAQYAQTNPIPSAQILLAPVLATIGNTTGATFSEVNPQTYVSTFTYNGPNQSIPIPAPIAGASLTLQDNGASISGVRRPLVQYLFK